MPEQVEKVIEWLEQHQAVSRISTSEVKKYFQKENLSRREIEHAVLTLINQPTRPKIRSFMGLMYLVLFFILLFFAFR
jgi:hypothetical protein